MKAAKGANGPPLSVVVVAVRFPSAAETFVTSRVRSLREMGNEVRALAFRSPIQGWRALLEERGLAGTHVLHNSRTDSLKGLLAAVRRPRLLLRTAAWLVSTCARHPRHLLAAFGVLPFAFRALADIQARTPDVVHLEWGHYPAVIVPLLRWSDTPCVISLSLVAYDIYKGFPGTRAAAHMADVVRTQAKANVAQIVEVTNLDPQRIELVPDGVDVRNIDALRTEVQKVPGRVVAVARLVPEKGIDDALRAFAAASETNAHATFRVMGSGPAESELKELAARLGVEDQVRFLGHVPHDTVLREIASAEALLHLSHKERLPNAVKEAMACRTVVVTTRTFGIEELIRHGKTGYLVDIHDHAAAGGALREVLGRPLDHDPMRASAADLVAKTMDHSASVAKLVDLWRAALARRAGDTPRRTADAKHGKVT